MAAQAEFSVKMYTARASSYEDSWHPAYSRRFLDQVGISEGQRVLDVCCGTGLEAFLAAEAVGDAGEVVGVDVTHAMLDEAIRKKRVLAEQSPQIAARMRFIHGDVTRLHDAFPELQKGSFDVVLCSNALVLLGDPRAALAHWRDYLRPGGIVAVDVPHERTMPWLTTLERVAKRMGLPSWPAGMSWIQSIDSLADILDETGYELLKAVEMKHISGSADKTEYSVDEADAQLDRVLNSHLALTAAVPELGKADFRERARPFFNEEWASIAEGGKVSAADSLYLYVARKK